MRYASLTEIGDQRTGKIRCGKVSGHGVHGKSGGLVEDKKILVLVNNIERESERHDVRRQRRTLGKRDGHSVTGMDNGVYVNDRIV